MKCFLIDKSSIYFLYLYKKIVTYNYCIWSLSNWRLNGFIRGSTVADMGGVGAWISNIVIIHHITLTNKQSLPDDSFWRIVRPLLFCVIWPDRCVFVYLWLFKDGTGGSGGVVRLLETLVENSDVWGHTRNDQTR